MSFMVGAVSMIMLPYLTQLVVWMSQIVLKGVDWWFTIWPQISPELHPMIWCVALAVLCFAFGFFSHYIYFHPEFDSSKEPRWKRRYRDKVTRQWLKQRYKHASIKDYGFHKSYPLHLRESSRFYHRAPNIPEQDLLSKLHE